MIRRPGRWISLELCWDKVERRAAEMEDRMKKQAKRGWGGYTPWRKGGGCLLGAMGEYVYGIALGLQPEPQGGPDGGADFQGILDVKGAQADNPFMMLSENKRAPKIRWWALAGCDEVKKRGRIVGMIDSDILYRTPARSTLPWGRALPIPTRYINWQQLEPFDADEVGLELQPRPSGLRIVTSTWRWYTDGFQGDQPRGAQEELGL